MALFQISYPELLRVVKTKVILSFLVLMTFLVTRLYLYLDLKNIHGLFPYPTIYSTIPFYISEIVIALSLTLFLHISGQMDHSESTQTERNSDHTPLILNDPHSHDTLALNTKPNKIKSTHIENTQAINDSMHFLLDASQELLEPTRMASTKHNT